MEVGKGETFESFYANLSSRLGENKQLNLLTSAFKNCQSDAERVRFVLKTETITNFLQTRTYLRPNLKSDSLSESFRSKGNHFFKKKNFNAALSFYTDSVFHAPCTGENTVNLSLAFANRSAVLFHISDFKGCLIDVEKALSFSYPDRLRYKLLDRLGRSQIKLGYRDAANKSFKLALNSLGMNTDLSSAKQNEMASELFRLQRMSDNENYIESGAAQCNTGCARTPEINRSDFNPKYPCARSSFDVHYDSYLGRCAIATRNIEAGELILFEKPFTSVLLPDKRLSHCHNCLSRCKNLIGCNRCSNAGFCGFECREVAWESYHHLECEYLQMIQDLEVGLGHLSLRMVIKAGFKNLMLSHGSCDIKDNSNEKTPMGLNAKGVYDSLDYISIFSLIGHSADRSLSDLFRRSVMAVLLLKFIENDKFFSEDSLKYTAEERKVCIASHILKHLQMLPCNAHEVSELSIDKSDIAHSELKEIGSAIYATLSLLNHSCDPSVVRHSYNDACALRAIKYIPKGGEIIDNYGALYPVTLHHERNLMLSTQYYFTCLCQACKNKWPLYSEIPNNAPIFKCPNCARKIKLASGSENELTHCQSCMSELPINSELFSSSSHDFEAAMESVLKRGCPLESLPCLLNHLQLVSKYVQLPWQQFNNCQEIVKQCYSMLANHHYI